ncbi:MAG: hypothetical protein A2X86_01790 [Bdellovibrionales bacterium GWA2_49_15]|nr:MAG: hypothetical protein A2X86_01790 [Bdellovibrionales bacterium GWA2_49_15]
MKKIILASLVLLGACGKQAAIIKAPSLTFQKRTFSGFSVDVQNKKFEEEARDITVLTYPTAADVENFEFSPTAERVASWEDMQAQLSDRYRSQMSSQLPLSMPADNKVAEIVAWINTGGEVRDNKFRVRIPLLGEKELNLKRIAVEDIKYRPAIEQALSEFSCFYKARPARGQKWDCRTLADADYKRLKKPSDCLEMDGFAFVYPSAEVETQYQAVKQTCNQNQDALNVSTRPLMDRNDQIDLDVQVASNTRDAAKSVVLDILESLEKVTGQIFVSAASSQDKKLDCPGDNAGEKCVSKLKFGEKNQTIEELVVYADFGVYSAEKMQTQEYSLANGRIRDLKFYTDKDSVKMLEFVMVTDLLSIKAKLSMTVQDDLQLRFVGETDVTYKNGSKRRGVMKFEFNEVKAK